MPPPQPTPPPTFWERYAQVQWLLQFPAVSVMLFMRYDPGYRLVNPLRIIVITGIIMVVAAASAKSPADDSVLFLFFFGFGVLLLGIGQRIKGWWRINRGIPHHSYDLGTSILACHWLPIAMRRNRRIERKIDPVVCALVGLAVRPVSEALSGWLLLSGVALYIYEFTAHERRRNHELDTVDNLIESSVQAETVERYENPNPARPSAPTTGVPTGLGHDILNNLKRRKK